MQALSISEFSVLGWCDGGIAGLHMAVMFPQAIKRLVTLGARSYVTENEIAVYKIHRDTNNWPRDYEVVQRRIYGSFLDEIWSNWTSGLNHCYTENKGDICTQELAKVTCPVLIVHGARDEMCPMFHGEYLRDHIRGSRLEIVEEGKHALLWKHAQLFNKLVEEFFNEREHH